MLDVTGCRAKIERAKKHIADFDAARAAFLDTNPYAVISQFNEEIGKTQFIIGQIPVIPDDLAVIAGDAAQNLRSALDYLANALRSSEAGVSRKTYFPIAENRSKYESELSGKTQGIPQKAVEVFSQIEPYGGGKGDSLWALHTINNADKHRLLVSVGTTIGHRGAQLQLSGEVTEFSVLLRSPGLKEGDVIGEVSDKTEGNHRIKYTFDIAFGEPEIIAGEIVVPTLQYFHNVVESIISYFESNF